MKALAMLPLLCLSLTARAHVPDSTSARFDRWAQYEDAKKDPGRAMVLSLLIPGVGHHYADRVGTGFLFMTAGVGTYFWVINADEGDDFTGAAITFLLVRVLDVLTAGSATDSYNEGLRMQLKLTHTAPLSLRLEIPL